MDYLYILLAIFLWSSLGVVVRLSGVAIHILIFYSVLVALIVQGIILSHKNYRKEIPDFKRLKYPLILGFISFLNTFTYFYAFKYTTIANAVLTHYIAPVIVAFLAPLFLREKITKKIIIVLIIASTGLWIMLNGFSFKEGHAAGIIAGLFSGLTYAMIIIVVRTHSRNFNPLVLAFFSNGVIAILLAPFVREIPLNALWSFLVMGIVHSTIAPVLYFKGLQSVTANRTAVLGYLEPVSAIIFSMIFLNELPGRNSIIGGMLIIFSGYLTLKNSSKVQKLGSTTGRKLLLFFCASALLHFCSPDSFAAEKLELTLGEAINISLKENLSLAQERINPKIAEGDIIFRKGEFDPNLRLSISDSFKKREMPYLYIPGAEERVFSYDAAIEGKINTGTTYELKWNNDRIKGTGYTLSPYYTSDLTLTVTQPILNGLGKSIQESNLNVARNNLDIARLRFTDRGIEIISDTSKAYWDLAFSRHDLEVAELSLKLAQNLLAEVKAKIDSGLLAPVEIYKAEAEVSLREEALLKAKKIALDAADRLRVVMNLKDWQSELMPVEKTPVLSEIQPVESAIDTAFNNRKDYKQAAIDYKNKEILRKYFDNQKYPDLNIIGSVGLNGLNGTYDNTIDKLSSRDYYSWQFGLSLRIPIGNRAAEGNYLKAKHEEEKSAIALKIIEQKITTEVREAWRSAQLASETIIASKKTRTAAEKRLEAEEGRFKVGMATLNDVLKFQEEYAKALSSEKKAEIDFAKAIVEIERVKGTLAQTIP